MKHFDVIVAGGGASGLFFTALIAKSNPKLRIALIEKNQRIGKKLLVTGNGRCNLTNLNTTAGNFHGSFSNYIKTVLRLCPPEKVLEIFKSMGLLVRSDEHSRVYPKSNQANSVLDVLRFNCEKENVEIILESKISDIRKKGTGYIVATDNESFYSEKVVVATGGAASPKSGGDKSGYELLRNLGHTIIKPSPALCPVNVKSEYIKSLKGIRAQGEISLICDNETIKTEEGEIQFTEGALSGICVFNLSSLIEKGKNHILRVKLLPELSFEEICTILYNNKTIYSSLEADNLMTGFFHKRISHALLKSVGIKNAKAVSEITDKELKSIAKTINAFDFEVSGLSDFNNAQVTKGGIKGDEINPETMESKKNKGLYILGEAIDCNGDCGGFNLQFAFATAYIAAKEL